MSLSRSWIRAKIAFAPSQPSLSWIAATPRPFATLIPSRVASTHSSSVTVTNRSRKRQADSSLRIPVGSPAPSRSTTPPGTSSSPSARASAALLSQSEW